MPAQTDDTYYAFTGWDKAFPATMPAGGLALSALWEANSHKVTYDYARSATDSTEATMRYGEFVVEPTVPTWEGHTFIRWDKYEGDSATCEPASFPFTVPDENVTLRAFWKVNQVAPGAPPATAVPTIVTLTDSKGDEEYVLLPHDTVPAAADWESAKKLGDGATQITFEGLVPNTLYDAYARKFETDTKVASPASERTEVKTPKADQDAPAAAPPAKAVSKTEAVVDPTQAGVEYAIVIKGQQLPDNPEWKFPNEEGGTVAFTGLAPETEYDVYARMKETERQKPSEASPAATAATCPPAVTPPAAAEDLVYDGQEKELLVRGAADEHGKMLYSSDGVEWAESVPTGIPTVRAILLMQAWRKDRTLLCIANE